MVVGCEVVVSGPTSTLLTMPDTSSSPMIDAPAMIRRDAIDATAMPIDA